jgi:uncharacterized protein (DUF58 family)
MRGTLPPSMDLRAGLSIRLPNRVAVCLKRLASYDVFPAFSAKVRRLLYNPLGVLILAALTALLCGVFLHSQGFVLFASVSAVIVLGIAWPWLTLRGQSGLISFEHARISEGETVDVFLTLRNRLPLPASGLAVRGGFTHPAKAGDAVSHVAIIPSVSGCRTARCCWSFQPPCRGTYPLEAPRLTTGFPFGLWDNQRALGVETPLIVWPRTFPVGPVPRISSDQQVEGEVSRSRVGNNGDVLGVRPYRRGDSPRRIHWGQSARHDRLIVCELQTNARPLVQLLLDTDAAVHAGHGPNGSREWAIRIVASLAKGWLAAGVEVGAVWHGQVLPASSGSKHLTALLDSLAALPDTPGPSLAETLAGPACRTFTNGLQVVVTTDAAAARVKLPDAHAEHRRWVVLASQGFFGSDACPTAPPAALLVRPWLRVDAPEQVPTLLRSGWKEAVHGS